MAQTRTATSSGGVIALILIGGALATGVAAVFITARAWVSPTMVGFRTSTAFFLIACLFTGLVLGAAVLLTRPRGPLAPILAAVSAFVAMEVGVRIGVIIGVTLSLRGAPDGLITDVLKPAFTRFQAYELLACAVAGGLATLRVLTAKTGGAASQQWSPPGGSFGGPGGPPFPAQQPAPGQLPFPGQQPAPYQPPGPAPGPGQGPAPGGPQGAPPPHGGA
ncbi:hypothetical protein [Spirillospora sp. CA-128828]|uniref:hypothetical protein n=1 Tax=Spirillospora sp. CA-128828 TaxID=3240033 RepID=UPI003D8E9FD5